MQDYQLTNAEILAKYQTQIGGLKSAQILELQKKYGKNVAVVKKQFSVLKLFVSQFLNLMAGVLLVAAFLSFIIGSTFDGFVILGIILLNSIIGFFQEYKAEKLVEALEKLVPQKCVVVRDGEQQEINVEELVPGDIVVLDEGDNVPADIKLLESFNLQTNDFVLTGESTPQAKFAGVVKKQNLSVSDIDNMVFLGMAVATGFAKGVVVATGLETEFGKIAKTTSEIVDEASPLQKQIAVLGKTVTKMTSVVILLLIGIFYLTNGYLDFFAAFQFAIGVASATVPEGLAATVSVALALGVSRMAKRNAIVKKLSATETLGTTTVICTDKTGTITKNEMTVKKVYFDGKEFSINGNGYETCGDICENNQKVSKQTEKELSKLINCGVLCNNAEFFPSGTTKGDNLGGVSRIVGDQTEGSLLVLAHKFGINPLEIESSNKRLFELPFDSNRKMMSTVNLVSGTKHIVNVKGALQEVLARSTHIHKGGKTQKITEQDCREINAKNDELASKAYRILALAQKEVGKSFDKTQNALESNLTFLGLVAIIDPPRTEIKQAIRDAQSAGIRIIMITGDYGLTAKAIGEQIGMGENLGVISGTDLIKLSDEELSAKLSKNIDQSLIFARVAPEDKMRIAGLLQKQGEIVAMTGDGVNDAPALRKADVGVAMGITGTDVSKEASDIVLADDNFSSIVAAIEEGRKIYDNLKKFILYIFSSNATEFFTVFFGVFIGVSPILALQILLIDLGTDILPSLALAEDPSTKNVMAQKPRDSKEKLLDKKILTKLFRIGVVIGLGALFAFVATLIIGGWSYGQEIPLELYPVATTVTYTTLVLCQVVNSFLCRDGALPFWKLVSGNRKLWWATLGSFILLLNIIYNPYIQPLAHTAPLGATEWMLAIIVALTFLLVEDGIKFVRGLNSKLSKTTVEISNPKLKTGKHVKIINNFTFLARKTRKRKLYFWLSLVVMIQLIFLLGILIYNNFESITNKSFFNNNQNFKINREKTISNVIISNENNVEIFRGLGYGSENEIVRWGDFLFYAKHENGAELWRYDLIKGEARSVFRDQEKEMTRPDWSITDISVVDNILYLSFGGYITAGEAYYLLSPFSQAVKMNINELEGYTSVGKVGETVLVESGWGDACGGFSNTWSFSPKNNQATFLYRSNNGCTQGSEFLGYTKNNESILTYHYSLKNNPDSQNTYYEKVETMSLNYPYQKKELISKEQMPEDVRAIAYDKKREQLILIGKEVYFYKIGGVVEEIAILDIPNNWEFGYYNFIEENVCINIMESVGVDEIDYNVWKFLINIEDKTMLNDVKSCETSRQKEIKMDNQKTIEYIKSLNLPKNFNVKFEYSEH